MRVVIGQGSCGIATGAKKTAAEFEKQIAEKNISNVTLGVTGCVGTCYLEPIVDVYDDDGKTTVSTDILIEQQTPNSCKKEECAVWHDGRCQYKK